MTLGGKQRQRNTQLTNSSIFLPRHNLGCSQEHMKRPARAGVWSSPANLERGDAASAAPAHRKASRAQR